MEQRMVAGRSSAGRGWAIAGIVCGLLTLVWTPIVFAVLGVALGFVGRMKGSVTLGNAAITLSIVLLVLIFAVNAVIGGMGALL